MPLAMLMEMVTEVWPERVVVGQLESGLSAAAAHDAARRGAAALRASGAGSIAFLDLNGPEFFVALWSSALAGLPFCPLNYRLSGEQLEPMLTALDRPVLIGAQTYCAPLAGSAEAWVATSEFIAAATDAAEPVPDLEPVDDSTTAVLLYTSGTTSAPKAVVLAHENLVSYVLETVEFGSADPDDAILVCMPPYHVAGVNGALTNLYSGRRLVHLPNFTASSWLETAARERATHAMVVPTMMARIVDELEGKPADLPHLRHIAYGGARMPRPVLEKALAAFPDVDFVNAYGLTETSSTIAILTPDDHRAAIAAEDAAGRDRLGSVGQPVPGIEVQVRDHLGRPLPVGQSGELWLRGRQISGSYLGRGSVLDADGWFPTRDRAHLDEQGYLFIEGRADDTIIRGGENIAPAEIEEVIITHEQVADVAVVGYPDDEWGERIVAVVVTRAGSNLASTEISDLVRAHLRGSRTPDNVVFVGELPYTATGKLVRRDVVTLLADSAAIRANR